MGLSNEAGLSVDCGAVMTPDMFKEELGNSSGVQGGDCGYGVDLLRQVVHHH